MKKNGYILFTVLFLNLILTLVVLSSMQALLLYSKMSNQVVIEHQQYYQLEAVAYSLVKRSSLQKKELRCIEKKTPVHQSLARLHQNSVCSMVVNQQRYDYLLRDLGVYPCLTIKVANTLFTSHHWLIRVTTSYPKVKTIHLRVAWPAPAGKCVLPYQHQINAGVVSFW